MTRHYDTTLGRHQASTLAATIQRDIDYGEFDASLAKYKPAASLSTVSPITPISPSATPQYDLGELWEKYADFKKPQLVLLLTLLIIESIAITSPVFQIKHWMMRSQFEIISLQISVLMQLNVL